MLVAPSGPHAVSYQAATVAARRRKPHLRVVFAGDDGTDRVSWALAGGADATVFCSLGDAAAGADVPSLPAGLCRFNGLTAVDGLSSTILDRDSSIKQLALHSRAIKKLFGSLKE